MEVCGTCEGTGSMERRDLDMSRMVDSMREDGDDEGIERYMRGAYDVSCDQCQGKNVVFVADWETVPEWASEAIESWEESGRITDRITAQERAMGA
jgi:DnaJ-class molecular chaperone